jgi:hypothetical protein
MIRVRASMTQVAGQRLLSAIEQEIHPIAPRQEVRQHGFVVAFQKDNMPVTLLQIDQIFDDFIRVLPAVDIITEKNQTIAPVVDLDLLEQIDHFGITSMDIAHGENFSHCASASTFTCAKGSNKQQSSGI